SVLFLLFVPKSVDALLNVKMVWYSAIFVCAYLVFLLTSFKKYEKPWFFYVLFLMVFTELIGSGLQSTENRIALEKKFFNQRTGHNDYTLEAVDYFKTQSEPFFRIEKTY